MKTHMGVEVQLHSFLVSTVHGGEWSLIPWERATVLAEEEAAFYCSALEVLKNKMYVACAGNRTRYCGVVSEQGALSAGHIFLLWMVMSSLGMTFKTRYCHEELTWPGADGGRDNFSLSFQASCGNALRPLPFKSLPTNYWRPYRLLLCNWRVG
jgi:hypothetical protein